MRQHIGLHLDALFLASLLSKWYQRMLLCTTSNLSPRWFISRYLRHFLGPKISLLVCSARASQNQSNWFRVCGLSWTLIWGLFGRRRYKRERKKRRVRARDSQLMLLTPTTLGRCSLRLEYPSRQWQKFNSFNVEFPHVVRKAFWKFHLRSEIWGRFIGSFEVKSETTVHFRGRNWKMVGKVLPFNFCSASIRLRI